MKIVLYLSILILSSAYAQESIHQEQLEYYNALGNANAEHYEAQHVENINYDKIGCNLNKVVYGWHPYWVGSAYQNYQWDLLSHFSFFSYEVNASDGQPISTHGWATSAAVDEALNSGNTKVTLCVTLFSNHTTFFGSPTAQQTLISNLINLVQSRGAHGVNIDFEGLPSSQTTNFANFMVDLANQMHAAIPNSEVSTVLYAVDWNNVFDFSIMEPEVDHYIIMGYAYYYSGSSTAGPTDPLYHFGSTYNYTLSRSITYYLDKGCPKSKLVLGLPYYGYEWPTANLTVPSTTTGSGSAKTYSQIMNNGTGNYTQANHSWETDAFSDVYAFNDGQNKQCFISQDSAFRKRLDHVNKTGIGGIGIWALGYDDGYAEMWSGIEDYLTDCYSDPCSGMIHDFGGPTKNYYNDEDYTWTIAPENAISIDFDFTAFDVELNWDYLYIYDGPDVSSPQIAGSPFTGTSGPGQFTSTNGAVTFRFTSDGATVTPGFIAYYTCNQQLAPVASILGTATTVCQGDSVLFVSNSSDADSLFWSSTSGTLSSTQNDSTYLVPDGSGNYNVTLEVFNQAGSDQITETFLITMVQNPVADFILSEDTVNIPGAVIWCTNNSINSNSYLWDFGDGNTSTDSEPWHEYINGGVYSGFLIANNPPCPSDTSYFTVQVGYVDLDELSLFTKVYPNPVTNSIHVHIDTDYSSIVLLTELGQQVELNMRQEGNVVILDARNLAPGTYFIRLLSEKGETLIPVVKI